MAFVKIRDEQYERNLIINTDVIQQIFKDKLAVNLSDKLKKGRTLYWVTLSGEHSPIILEKTEAQKIFDVIGVSL